MNVTTKFKRAILAGHGPALTDPDLHPGQVIDIEPNYVWDIVLRWRKGGTWAYTVRDDRPRLLGKASGETHISSRAIGSSDNTEPGNLWAEPERIDRAAEDKIAGDALPANRKLRQRQRFDPDALAAEQRTLENRLGLARKVAEIRKVDISSHERVIADRLRRIEKQLAAAEEAA